MEQNEREVADLVVTLDEIGSSDIKALLFRMRQIFGDAPFIEDAVQEAYKAAWAAQLVGRLAQALWLMVKCDGASDRERIVVTSIDALSRAIGLDEAAIRAGISEMVTCGILSTLDETSGRMARMEVRLRIQGDDELRECVVKSPKFRTRTKMLQYLFVAAKRRAQDILRGDRRRAELRHLRRHDVPTARPSTPADVRVLLGEARRRMRHRNPLLPILMLRRFWLGMTCREIAQCHSMDDVDVRKTTDAGRRELRQLNNAAPSNVTAPPRRTVSTWKNPRTVGAQDELRASPNRQSSPEEV